MRHTWFALVLALAACSAGGSSRATPPTMSQSGDPARLIEEADIIQLANGRLYALSKSGSLSVIDVSQPGQLALLGQTSLTGTPFEMYLRGGVLLVMTNDDASGGELVTIDIASESAPKILWALELGEEIADSRIIGDILYLATYDDVALTTSVTSYNIGDPSAALQVDHVTFESSAGDAYDLAWGSHWKRSIVANDQRLYVGGHANVDPSVTGVDEGIVDVLDITDPSGKLGRGTQLTVAGAILSRWQLDETNGVLRVISEAGAGYTANGTAMPVVQTFQIVDDKTFEPLGRTQLALPMQEGLRTVRFDGNRAYAITYNQTDPLFVIDLADPTAPKQRGELAMPGFMYYLEPHGDRVIGLGIDREDAGGSLNVSLFDVADADQPKLLSRVAFATPYVGEDYAILNGEINDDQDRIGQAFRVLGDGLVVVPFTNLTPPATSAAEASSVCANAGGGVEVVSWTNDSLAHDALLPLPGNPRRAFENAGELVTVSDSNVRTFPLASLAAAQSDADLTIDTCTPDDYTGLGGYRGSDQVAYACSASRGGTGSFALIALACAFAFRARSRSRPRAA